MNDFDMFQVYLDSPIVQKFIEGVEPRHLKFKGRHRVQLLQAIEVLIEDIDSKAKATRRLNQLFS